MREASVELTTKINASQQELSEITEAYGLFELEKYKYPVADLDHKLSLYQRNSTGSYCNGTALGLDAERKKLRAAQQESRALFEKEYAEISEHKDKEAKELEMEHLLQVRTLTDNLASLKAKLDDQRALVASLKNNGTAPEITISLEEQYIGLVDLFRQHSIAVCG